MWKDIKELYNRSEAVSRIILINVGIYILMNLFGIIGGFLNLDIFDNISYDYLSLPSSPTQLLFRPWALLTYMFVHGGFMHLFWNMLLLYFAGRSFIAFLGVKHFVSTYFIGGIAAGIGFFVSYNLFPSFDGQVSVLVGASGAIMTIFVALGTHSPNYPVRFWILPIPPIKLKWIVAVFVIQDFIRLRTDLGASFGGNEGGWIAHIIGALTGYLIIKQYQKGNYFLRYVENSIDQFVTFISGFKKPRSGAKMKVVYKKETVKSRKGKRVTDHDYNMSKQSRQEHLDEILDKIFKHGYESLNQEEKDFLKKTSENE